MPAGGARPAPPVGPALGQYRLNLMAFCKDFNAGTQKYKPDTPMAVTITAFKDNTFEFTVKSPSVTWYLKKLKTSSKTKYYEAEQNVLAPLEKTRSYETMSNEKEHVICAKAQRGRVLSQMFVRPFRYNLSQQVEGCDSKGEADVLDIIFEENYGEERTNEAASSPPYFVGSPPVRSGNPLIQDSQFVYETNTSAFLSSSSSASSDFLSPRKGGCVRTRPGLNPAAVRVEGFDCHIPAVS